MGNLRWPSFIIQGIILATCTTLVLADSRYHNKWILFSIFAILVLFALQTTSERFIYLFPIGRNRNPTPHIDTHILRILIMLSLFFLYLGFLYPLISTTQLVLGLLLILGIPLLFNFLLNSLIRNRNDRA